jgi:hypothetical protein
MGCYRKPIDIHLHQAVQPLQRKPACDGGPEYRREHDLRLDPPCPGLNITTTLVVVLLVVGDRMYWKAPWIEKNRLDPSLREDENSTIRLERQTIHLSQFPLYVNRSTII